MSLGPILERFASCDLADPIQRSFVVRDLQTLRDSLSRDPDDALASCLGAATGLASLCRTADRQRVGEITDVLQRLLRLVATEAELRAVNAAPPAAPGPQGASPAAPVPAPPDVDEPTTINDMMLGQILVEFGLLSVEQTEKAQQLCTGGVTFGQAVVQLGFVTEEDLRNAISFQERLRGKGGKGGKPKRTGAGIPSPNLLGQILVRKGLVTAEQLEAALALQKEQQIRLGDALVELGAITFQGLRDALIEQHSSR